MWDGTEAVREEVGCKRWPRVFAAIDHHQLRYRAMRCPSTKQHDQIQLAQAAVRLIRHTYELAPMTSVARPCSCSAAETRRSAASRGPDRPR